MSFFFFLLSRQIKEKIPGACSVLPFSHSSACWLVSPSCICKRNKHHTQKVCQATRSPFAQQRYVAKYSPFCFVYLIFVLQSVVFCTVLPSTLLVFSLTLLESGRQGLLRLLVVPLRERGRWRGDARGPSLCLPTRLVLQGHRRGRGGPIFWAAGGHQAVHPDRLAGVDHPERGKPSSLSTSPALPCSLL